MKNNRSGILEKAISLINGDRAQAYGPADPMFTSIASLWSAYLNVPVTKVDVARMMILLKIARSRANDASVDSWVDMAGYSGLGGEMGAAVASEEQPSP